MMIASHRKKHLAYLMADQGLMVGNPELTSNLPKQTINRRRLKRSQSLVSQIFHGDNERHIGLYGNANDWDDIRLKNVRQTEILVDLKEAIIKIARHFIAVDPATHQRANLQVIISASLKID